MSANGAERGMLNLIATMEKRAAKNPARYSDIVCYLHDLVAKRRRQDAEKSRIETEKSRFDAEKAWLERELSRLEIGKNQLVLEFLRLAGIDPESAEAVIYCANLESDAINRIAEEEAAEKRH